MSLQNKNDKENLQKMPMIRLFLGYISTESDQAALLLY